MDSRESGYMASAARDYEGGLELLDKLVDVAQPEAVYGAPLAVGDVTVITASEVTAGVGFMFGAGEGTDQSSPEPGSSGAGGGGGGGGASGARPVAVITVDRDGVRVEPILDITKIGIAALTALGTMFMMFRSMARGK